MISLWCLLASSQKTETQKHRPWLLTITSTSSCFPFSKTSLVFSLAYALCALLLILTPRQQSFKHSITHSWSKATAAAAVSLTAVVVEGQSSAFWLLETGEEEELTTSLNLLFRYVYTHNILFYLINQSLGEKENDGWILVIIN